VVEAEEEDEVGGRGALPAREAGRAVTIDAEEEDERGAAEEVKEVEWVEDWEEEAGTPSPCFVDFRGTAVLFDDLALVTGT
jgi:hypothetical protein